MAPHDKHVQARRQRPRARDTTADRAPSQSTFCYYRPPGGDDDGKKAGVRQVVATGLPPEPAPFSHAVVANGVVFTAHLPIRADGTAETGSATAQAELALSNLERAIGAAGASLDDVAQVILFITHGEDKPAIDAVYARYFRSPYPSRACVVVKELVVPGTRLEVLAYATLPE
jgi:enamine deaminase RidA (YjgF/YER057c/UK114 family)